MFDDESPLEQGAIVVAFSLLHSSTTLFNLHQNLDERQLQFLQTFAECARMTHLDTQKQTIQPTLSSELADPTTNAVVSDCALPSSSIIPRPFQHLLMLVRDWCSPSDCAYGALGGAKLLQKRSLKQKPKIISQSQSTCKLLRNTSQKKKSLKSNEKGVQRISSNPISAVKANQINQTSNTSSNLNVKKIAEQNEALRCYLLDSFERLDAFLLPYPGPSVAASPTHDGRWSEWSNEFCTHIHSLVSHLHSSLVPVHALGAPFARSKSTALNGSQLLNRCLQLTSKIFLNGAKTLPLFEALGELSHAESVELVCNQYSSELKNLFGVDKPWVNARQWRIMEQQSRNNALAEYNCSRRFNAQSLGETYRKELLKRLKQISNRYWLLNRHKQQTKSWKVIIFWFLLLVILRLFSFILRLFSFQMTYFMTTITLIIIAFILSHVIRYIWDSPVWDFVNQIEQNMLQLAGLDCF